MRVRKGVMSKKGLSKFTAPLQVKKLNRHSAYLSDGNLWNIKKIIKVPEKSCYKEPSVAASVPFHPKRLVKPPLKMHDYVC